MKDQIIPVIYGSIGTRSQISVPRATARALVIGSPNYTDPQQVPRELDYVHSLVKITHLVHQGRTGPEQWAQSWADAKGVPHSIYSAEASPRRTLEHTEASLVIGFGLQDLVQGDLVIAAARGLGLQLHLVR